MQRWWDAAVKMDGLVRNPRTNVTQIRSRTQHVPQSRLTKQWRRERPTRLHRKRRGPAGFHIISHRFRYLFFLLIKYFRFELTINHKPHQVKQETTPNVMRHFESI